MSRFRVSARIKPRVTGNPLKSAFLNKLGGIKKRFKPKGGGIKSDRQRRAFFAMLAARGDLVTTGKTNVVGGRLRVPRFVGKAISKKLHPNVQQYHYQKRVAKLGRRPYFTKSGK